MPRTLEYIEIRVKTELFAVKFGAPEIPNLKCYRETQTQALAEASENFGINVQNENKWLFTSN